MVSLIRIGQSHFNLERIDRIRWVNLPDANSRGGHVKMYFHGGEVYDIMDAEEISQLQQLADSLAVKGRTAKKGGNDEA